MAKGDLANPYNLSYPDYQGLVLSVSVPWNATTRAITSASVHRDVGCQYHTIVFANPTDQLLRKDLPAMTDAQTDATFTANQVRQRTGFQTIDDLLAAGQITAEP